MKIRTYNDNDIVMISFLDSYEGQPVIGPSENELNLNIDLLKGNIIGGIEILTQSIIDKETLKDYQIISFKNRLKSDIYFGITINKNILTIFHDESENNYFIRFNLNDVVNEGDLLKYDVCEGIQTRYFNNKLYDIVFKEHYEIPL